MKDYINIRKFQQGGTVEPQAEAQTEATGEQDALTQMIQRVVESQDAQLALELVNQLAQQMGIGSSAPIFAKGGKMKKMKKGGYANKMKAKSGIHNIIGSTGLSQDKYNEQKKKSADFYAKMYDHVSKAMKGGSMNKKMKFGGKSKMKSQY